jgi:antitoxin HigA-1
MQRLGTSLSRPRHPAHPGEVLREYLPKGMGVAETAKHLVVSRQYLTALLAGRARVSADVALRLESAFGTTAEKWVEMQSGFDLRLARQTCAAKVAGVGRILPSLVSLNRRQRNSAK